MEKSGNHRSKTRNARRTSAIRKSKSGSNSDQLKKVFEDELKDIYWAEKYLTKSLQKVMKAVQSEDLSSAISNHLEETEEHIERLEEVFDICGLKIQTKKCEAMAGMVAEAQEIISNHPQGIVRDSGLIIAAQKIEHYEMAAYGSLRSLARVLGFDEAVDLLQETLDEEGNADKILTDLSESINVMAMEESGMEHNQVNMV